MLVATCHGKHVPTTRPGIGALPRIKFVVLYCGKCGAICLIVHSIAVLFLMKTLSHQWVVLLTIERSLSTLSALTVLVKALGLASLVDVLCARDALDLLTGRQAEVTKPRHAYRTFTVTPMHGMHLRGTVALEEALANSF